VNAPTDKRPRSEGEEKSEGRPALAADEGGELYGISTVGSEAKSGRCPLWALIRADGCGQAFCLGRRCFQKHCWPEIGRFERAGPTPVRPGNETQPASHGHDRLRSNESPCQGRGLETNQGLGAKAADIARRRLNLRAILPPCRSKHAPIAPDGRTRRASVGPEAETGPPECIGGYRPRDREAGGLN
jgi:hypothetical protein